MCKHKSNKADEHNANISIIMHSLTQLYVEHIVRALCTYVYTYLYLFPNRIQTVGLHCFVPQNWRKIGSGTRHGMTKCFRPRSNRLHRGSCEAACQAATVHVQSHCLSVVAFFLLRVRSEIALSTLQFEYSEYGRSFTGRGLAC